MGCKAVLVCLSCPPGRR